MSFNLRAFVTATGVDKRGLPVEKIKASEVNQEIHEEHENNLVRLLAGNGGPGTFRQANRQLPTAVFDLKRALRLRARTLPAFATGTSPAWPHRNADWLHGKPGQATHPDPPLANRVFPRL